MIEVADGLSIQDKDAWPMYEGDRVMFVHMDQYKVGMDDKIVI